jgi:hypothetical protein
MVERDPVLGYCVDCPRVKEILGRSARDSTPSSEQDAALVSTVLAGIGESALQRNCQGSIPDIAYGQPILNCGLHEGQLTVEDVRRMQAEHGIENPWQ